MGTPLDRAFCAWVTSTQAHNVIKGLSNIIQTIVKSVSEVEDSVNRSTPRGQYCNRLFVRLPVELRWTIIRWANIVPLCTLAQYYNSILLKTLPYKAKKNAKKNIREGENIESISSIIKGWWILMLVWRGSKKKCAWVSRYCQTQNKTRRIQLFKTLGNNYHTQQRHMAFEWDGRKGRQNKKERNDIKWKQQWS